MSTRYAESAGPRAPPSSVQNRDDSVAMIFRPCRLDLTAIALCMVVFLAAVTQSPITCAIIVMEMIDSHGMVISLMFQTTKRFTILLRSTANFDISPQALAV